MANVSLAGVSIIAFFITAIARGLGLDLDEGQITELSTAVLLVGTFVGIVFGQLRRKDLKLGLFRKMVE